MRMNAPSESAAMAMQYITLQGEFLSDLEDPYIGSPVERAPPHDEVNVVVAGGGLAGLMAARDLRKAGVESVRIIEKAADFRGTWYWNRQPGGLFAVLCGT